MNLEEERTVDHVLTGQNMRQPRVWVVVRKMAARAERLLDGAANLKSYIYEVFHGSLYDKLTRTKDT